MKNSVEIADFFYPNAKQENLLLSKIYEILGACECSQNLIISIYLIEENYFLYCNNRLKNIVGGNYAKLLLEGWDFWFSLIDPEESLAIKDRVTNFFTIPYIQDPLTLRYHITDFNDKRICVKHEIFLHRMERHTLAINYFFDVTDKERIERCFGVTKNIEGSQFSKEHILNISTREKEVLQLIANGFSSKEIADMLFISNHTAISHRKNLIEKFQVKNTAHLIKKAAGFICL